MGNSNPCSKCPWMEKNQPLITEELKKSVSTGSWACCHINLGTCHGAELYKKKTHEK